MIKNKVLVIGGAGYIGSHMVKYLASRGFAPVVLGKQLIDKSLSGAQGFNLGNGNGFSVKEVIEMAGAIVSKDGKVITVDEAERRPGDPAVLVADAKAATEIFNWQPEYPGLEEMVKHACLWELRQR